MADKANAATISGSNAQSADEDATLMRQLEEELKNTSMDDDDGVSSSSSTASIASAKVQANMLSAREQELADQGMLDGVQIFFENQFVEAQRIFATQDQVNPVYALGSGALAFMKACMTFNESDIATATKLLQHAEALCDAQIQAAPKKTVPLMTSVSKLVSSGWSYFGYKDTNKSKSNNHAGAHPPPLPKHMTNGEIRARVIRAESLLLTSLILLLQESIMSYLKAGLNLRKGYKSYENVWLELKSMGDEVNTLVDNNTLGGIHFGLGTINIVLAMMPAKILRIISSFGYTGDKAFGFDLVSKAISGKGIRSPLGSLMFLAYYTILAGFAPSVLGETNIPIADKILKDALRDYRESAFFLYFEGRNSRLKGNIKESTDAFELASSKATIEWGSELQRLCDYELGLNCAISLQWTDAIVYFERLAKENYWSKAFFLYFKAASFEAAGHKKDALAIYQSIPGLVNRKFGGRTILVEQYVTRKVKLFEQNGFEETNLPALEILLIWNAFASMTPQDLQTSLTQVDAQISKNRGSTGLDSLAVLKTIKGAILHQLGRHKEGAECLTWVMDLPAGKITEEKWVVPFACWEAGVGSWMEDKDLQGDRRWTRAKGFWDKAMGFSGYEFEFRLSVRIHAAMMRINDMVEQTKLKPFH
ncbi:tetratricopeptide repeat domain 39A [Linnemannia schmuckeri]|uniref:Tetratricopeptide repeat domain 39A n=1 Tax=Linnemannia schmuckeri TaxID=64567 RepID=A0A9P5RZI7_9FUNG|nr:tetratricopeptide repeat domain 39A [Linnemannia schmuckeri]